MTLISPPEIMESVVEYRFYCFCGAPIVTTEKIVTCANCGESYGSYSSIRRIEGHKQRYSLY